MYRVAVVQNQSESLRAGYADIARNFSQQLRLDGYEFVQFDGSNIDLLFNPACDINIFTFDSLFVSTNATSDEKTRKAFKQHVSHLDKFLHNGKGIFLGYQKKMSVDAESSGSDGALLPEPYRVSMKNRPNIEPDSSDGIISITTHPRQHVGSFLLLNSPHVVDEDLIMTHCHENDFKAHVYRAVLIPENGGAYNTVLEDKSYGDSRRLMLVNRSSVSGERVVVATIAVDWEGHWRLLENIIRYVTEGIPRVALIDRLQSGDIGFDFIRSTAKLLRVTNRQYSTLNVPANFALIHDVYVVSAKWAQDDVEAFWRSIAGPKAHAIQSAASFRRLYHLGDPARGCTSLTRYVNYTSIDVVMNEALLWLEQQFRGGFWAGGFWNTHDVLVMMDGLNIDASLYLPGVLRDIKPHLRSGGYDAVMGPSCGLLSLLNRLSIKYQVQLESCEFTVERRALIASWILDNLEGQSEVARQVAARALFGNGGEPVLACLHEKGRGEAIKALRSIIRKGLNVSIERISSLSEMDLVRLVQLTFNVPAVTPILTASLEELKRRQDSSGLWGSVGRTANIVTSILEINDTSHAPVQVTGWDEVISRAVEALRGEYNREMNSWGGIIQDTAMSVHALGLYRARYDVESQELFETVEADARASERASSVGGSRIDLGELFARELEREDRLRKSETEVATARAHEEKMSLNLIKAHKRAAALQISGGTCFLLLVALLLSFWLYEEQALKNVLTGAGSLLGLMVGAIIAVPVTYLLTPHSKNRATATLGKEQNNA